MPEVVIQVLNRSINRNYKLEREVFTLTSI
jgi:hypothetical protein